MSNQNHQPKQRDIWLFDPDPVTGNELGFKERPALIVSNDLINHGPAQLVIVVPCTSKNKNIPSHVLIEPPAGGLEKDSYAICEQIRCISKLRLKRKLGSVDLRILQQVLGWIADLIRPF